MANVLQMKVIPQPKLLPGLSWEMWPLSLLCPWALVSRSRAGPSPIRAQGQQLAPEHCAMGCDAQGKVWKMREGAQEKIYRVHSGQGPAAAATSNISCHIRVYPKALLGQSDPLLFSCILGRLLPPQTVTELSQATLCSFHHS